MVKKLLFSFVIFEKLKKGLHFGDLYKPLLSRASFDSTSAEFFCWEILFNLE